MGVPFVWRRYIPAFGVAWDGMQANRKRCTCFLDAHSVWVEDIRCDTCGAGRIYKAAWEFLPINWQTDIYLKHLTCLQQPKSWTLFVWYKRCISCSRKLTPSKTTHFKEKVTVDLSESEIHRDQTEVVSNRVWSLILGPQLTQSCWSLSIRYL